MVFAEYCFEAGKQYNHWISRARTTEGWADKGDLPKHLVSKLKFPMLLTELTPRSQGRSHLKEI